MAMQKGMFYVSKVLRALFFSVLTTRRSEEVRTVA